MEETKKISIWDQFLISCTKPSQYKNLIGIPKVKVAIFVLLVTLITTLFGTVMDFVGLNVSIGGMNNFIENRLPKFELKDGTLTADSEMDFTLAGVRFVMDTSKDKVSNSDFSEQGAMEIIFSKKQMVSINHAMGQKLTINYSNYKDAVVKNSTLLKYIPIVHLIAIITMILSFVFSIIGYLILAVFTGWMASWTLKVRKQNIPFGSIFQVALYARVPSMLIETIGTLIGISIFSTTTWWFVSYIITYELILFAFREPKPKQVEE